MLRTEKFFIPDDPNFKQHINIDQNTWECIENDIWTFTNMPEVINQNGFLNRIILNCCRDAKVTISYHITNLKLKYDSILKNDRLTSDLDKGMKNKVINALMENKKLELYEALNTKKGKQIQIKLHKKVKDIIMMSDECYYYEGNLGKYLKSILQGYAKLSNVERERLYYLDTFQKLSDAIKDSVMVSINVGSRIDTFFPYCVREDKSKMFNYVAGFQVSSGGTGLIDARIVSYRLSNIIGVEFFSRERIDFTKLERDKIESEIKNKEIRFLLGEIDSIKIYLTTEGIRSYRYQIHQRPKYFSVDETGHIFEFHSTQRQIVNYFFKFGKDAVILEPEQLRKKMFDLYTLAHEAYID